MQVVCLYYTITNRTRTPIRQRSLFLLSINQMLILYIGVWGVIFHGNLVDLITLQSMLCHVKVLRFCVNARHVKSRTAEQIAHIPPTQSSVSCCVSDPRAPCLHLRCLALPMLLIRPPFLATHYLILCSAYFFTKVFLIGDALRLLPLFYQLLPFCFSLMLLIPYKFSKTYYIFHEFFSFTAFNLCLTVFLTSIPCRRWKTVFTLFYMIVIILFTMVLPLLLRHPRVMQSNIPSIQTRLSPVSYLAPPFARSFSSELSMSPYQGRILDKSLQQTALTVDMEEKDISADIHTDDGDDSLYNVLIDPNKYLSFKQFLSSEHSVESLQCWEAVRILRLKQEHGKLKTHDLLLFNLTYIHPTAPAEVNLSGQLRQCCQRLPDCRDSNTIKDTLQELENALFCLMKSDPFPRYQISPFGKSQRIRRHAIISVNGAPVSDAKRIP